MTTLVEVTQLWKISALGSAFGIDGVLNRTEIELFG